MAINFRPHETGPRDHTPLHRLAHLGEFLRHRREQLRPAEVGLPPGRGKRRTQGLRREDVAALAQLSVAWYTKLEQGRDVHPSRAALHAIAAALQLDPVERTYMFRLAGEVDPASGRAASALESGLRAVDCVPSPDAPDGTPAPLRRLLASLAVPALLMDRYWDVVGRNALLEGLVSDIAPPRTDPEVPPRNIVRRVLTTQHADRDPREWEALARTCVSGLRATLADIWAVHPDDAYAAALVAALARESPEFQAWWPEHSVWAAHRPLRRVYDHPHLGAVAVEITLLDVRSAPGLTLAAFVGSDEGSAAKLRQLANPPRTR